MNRKLKKIDISEVYLVQLLKLNDRKYKDLFLSELEYFTLNEYTFVYKVKKNWDYNEQWYDICNEKFIPTDDRVYDRGEIFFDKKYRISLLEMINIDDYCKNRKRIIKYDDLLYIIEPINQYFKEMVNDRYFELINLDNLFTGSVRRYNQEMDNVVLKPYKYFAIATDNNEIVSYRYIKNEIPYITSKTLTPFKSKQKVLRNRYGK